MLLVQLECWAQALELLHSFMSKLVISIDQQFPSVEHTIARESISLIT
jgi:hypothetical protein